MQERWLPRLVFSAAVLVFAGAQAAIWDSGLRVSGDEPHELMTVISIVKDHDLNLYPNYRRQDYREIGWEFLGPQVRPVGAWIPPEKGIGFPALLVPFYSLAGKTGARLAVVCLAALSIPLLYFLCTGAGLDRLGASLACLGLAACLPWEVHANLILPEAVAGLITLAIAASFLQFDNTGRRGYALAVGLLTIALPILYLKYAALAVASGVLLLSSPRLRRSGWTYAGAPLLVLYAALWVAVYGWSIAIGTGGGLRDFSAAGLSRNFWNALFDRHHGLWPYAPLTALAVWGFITGPPAGRRIRGYLVAVVTAYMLLYGLTTLKPGNSAPGRYLSAAIPAFTALAALGLLKDSPRRSWRVALFSVGVGLSAAVLAAAIGRNGFQIASWYLGLFPVLY